jgi:predicted O-methyltransferase YrrM
MLRKLKTLLWYLRRPRFYPQLPDLVKKNLSAASLRRDNTRQEALQWCAERSVDTNTAIRRLTGFGAPEPVRSLFPAQFNNAERTASECPAEMGGPGDLDLLYWSAEYLSASRVVETGVACGWSSLAILLSLQRRQGARLFSTDMPYPNRKSAPYIGCVVPAELRSYWSLLKWPDRHALPKALNEAGAIDMCHYDSDKSHDGRMWAYSILWRALRPGGFFISDDIEDNVAFGEFSRRVASDPIVIKKGDKFIGVLVKPLG